MRDSIYENQAKYYLANTDWLKELLPLPAPCSSTPNQKQAKPKLKYFPHSYPKGKRMEKGNVRGIVFIAVTNPIADGNSISSSLKHKDIFCTVAHAQKFFSNYVFGWMA